MYYRLCWGSSFKVLQDEVNYCLGQGYDILGSPFFAFENVAQAMIHRSLDEKGTSGALADELQAELQDIDDTQQTLLAATRS